MSLSVHEITVDDKLVDFKKPLNNLAQLIKGNVDKIH